MINYGVVICSRLDSSRIKEKCFFKFIGIPLLEHLLNRLTSLPVFIAVPQGDYSRYSYLTDKYPNVRLESGTYDPMHRMYGVARKHNIQNVIRINHDKIFVDSSLISESIRIYERENSDYLYSSHLTDGSGFEIISTRLLEQACIKYRDCEHISYAVRSVAQRCINFKPKDDVYTTPVRLLIDYPEDLSLINSILSRLGKEASLLEVLNYLCDHSTATKANRQPELTIYTCAYNMEKFIAECIR